MLYAAHDREREHEVAVKLVRPNERLRPNVVTALVDAMRATTKLENDHTARVLHVDTTDLGVPFFVREWIVAEDLETIVRRRGALPISEAVAVVRQTCESVAEAHRRGIAHGSLSSTNVLVTKDHLVHVTEFALKKGDERDDVRALGLMLHRLLTGHEFTRGKPIASHGIETPPMLEAIVMRCVADDPNDRYADASELQEAIDAFAARKEDHEEPDSTPRSARVIPLPIARVIALSAGGAPTSFSSRRERPMWIALIGVVIAVLGISLYVTLRPPRRSGAAPAAASTSASTSSMPSATITSPEPTPSTHDPLLDCPRPPTDVKPRFYVAIEIMNLGFHPNQGLETAMEHAAVCELALHAAFRVVPHDGRDPKKMRDFAEANGLEPWKWSISFGRSPTPDFVEFRVTTTRKEVPQASLLPVRHVELRQGDEPSAFVEKQAGSIVRELVSAVDRPTTLEAASTCHDYVEAMRAKDYACVRTLLLPQLDANVITTTKARYLTAACAALGDSECKKRAADKL